MKNRTYLAIFLSYVSIVAGLLVSSLAYASSYQPGNYPRFSYATISPSGERVSDGKNLILRAIENNHTIPLKYDAQFKSTSHYIFPDGLYGGRYNSERASSKTFVDVISKAISEFSCAEYRFRHRLAETPQCNGYVLDEQKKEHMPFVSGQFTRNRIESNLDNPRNNFSYQAYLKSSQEKELESAFGSVHELGTFFGRMARSNSLVLSIDVNIYRLDANANRSEPINTRPITYFIILPSAVEISRQKSQRAAANFAISNARLLILGM